MVAHPMPEVARKMRISTLALIFAVAALTPMVTAGGGGGGGSTPIDISGFVYSPSNVTVETGATVVWTNLDSATHTVSNSGGGEPFDSGSMVQDDTFSWTFNVEGDFQYHCNIHTSMTAVVHVVAPGGGGGNTTGNGTGNETGNGSETPDQLSMLIWWPDGSPDFVSFEMNGSNDLWDASIEAFDLLLVDYTHEVQAWGVMLLSVNGLSSEAEFGDDEYWYWGLYVMNSSGIYESSPTGASDTNASNGTEFAWVATNGSWGPFEYSVTQMLMGQQNVSGCMDSDADNYDPNATEDDGSCTYSTDPVLGCTDSAADNFDSAATEDDGSCTYSSDPILGCMDPAANNFNSAATEDDGSCDFDLDDDGVTDANEIAGCMDQVANNYNSSATDDDGSCDFDLDDDGITDANEIAGCTNSTASNFDAAATDDDGSCLPVDDDSGAGNTGGNEGGSTGGNTGGNNGGSTEGSIEDKTSGLTDMVPGGTMGIFAIAALMLIGIGWFLGGRN